MRVLLVPFALLLLAGCSGSASDADLPPRLESIRPSETPSPVFAHSAKAQIDAERAQAVQQLRTEVGGLATSLAGKIVGESLDDDERARRTVDRFIADLEANSQEKV